MALFAEGQTLGSHVNIDKQDYYIAQRPSSPKAFAKAGAAKEDAKAQRHEGPRGHGE